jgi:isoamylase
MRCTAIASNRPARTCPSTDATARRHAQGVVVDDYVQLGHDRSPETVGSNGVLRSPRAGLTMRANTSEQDARGTFAALADPYVIDHLVKLGITSIELLPVHAFLQDRRLVEKKLRNYWGYNTLAFFAPEPSYLSDGSLNEMRRAIRQLHLAGIEVILDVVYNHTCEESELGPTLSFRGLDNASYYRLLPDNPRHCINDTGCGNTVNLSHPRVLQMVMDSLRYWVQAFHVDGFRFDLGVTLGREATGFDPGCGFFDALRQDPVLSQTKLIPSRGTSAPAAIRSATIRPAGPNGTVATATTCAASGKATPACARRSRRV